MMLFICLNKRSFFLVAVYVNLSWRNSSGSRARQAQSGSGLSGGNMLQPMCQNMCNWEQNKISRHIIHTHRQRGCATYTTVEITVCFEKSSFLNGKRLKVFFFILLDELTRNQSVKACNALSYRCQTLWTPCPSRNNLVFKLWLPHFQLPLFLRSTTARSYFW